MSEQERNPLYGLGIGLPSQLYAAMDLMTDIVHRWHANDTEPVEASKLLAAWRDLPELYAMCRTTYCGADTALRCKAEYGDGTVSLFDWHILPAYLGVEQVLLAELEQRQIPCSFVPESSKICLRWCREVAWKDGYSRTFDGWPACLREGELPASEASVVQEAARALTRLEAQLANAWRTVSAMLVQPEPDSEKALDPAPNAEQLIGPPQFLQYIAPVSAGQQVQGQDGKTPEAARLRDGADNRGAWCKPSNVKALASRCDVHRNTMAKSLGQWQLDGSAKKVGSRWIVNVNIHPECDDPS